MPFALATVGGLVAGSFLNVVIARLPDGRSLVFGKQTRTNMLTMLTNEP